MVDDGNQLSDHERRRFLKLSAVAGTGVATALAGCSGGDDDGTTTSNTDSGDVSGGDDGDSGDGKTTFRFATVAEQVSLDAANANLSYGWEWSYIHYNALVKLEYDWENEEIVTVPDLAEEYEFVDDRTVEYSLRDDVTFHNGDDLTAERVRKDIQYNIDNATTIRGQVFNNLWITDVTAEDDTTVRVHHDKPINSMFWGWLMPRVMIANPDVREERGEGNFATNPAGGGTGPYQFASYTSGSEIVLERYDDYYEDGVPAFEEAVCKILPEGSTRMAQLQTGDLDLDNFISANNWRSLEDNDDLVNRRAPSSMTISVQGNFQYDDSLEPMKDKRVRRALAQAVNREEFNQAVFQGTARPVSIWDMEDYWFNYPELQERNFYDLENAQALMEEAGYGDGFEVEMLHGSDSWHSQMAQIVSSMWSELGVEVQLTPTESSTIWARIGQGDFPLALSENLSPPTPHWLLGGVAPSLRAPDAVYNGYGWEENSDLAEEYFELAQTAPYTSDEEEHRQMTRRMYEIYAEEMPMWWFSNADNLAVHAPELEDWWMYPGDYSREANRYVTWDG